MSVRTDAAEAAEVLRRLLDAIGSDEMTATSPSVRSRLEGAAIAFEAVARGERFDIAEVVSQLRHGE